VPIDANFNAAINADVPDVVFVWLVTVNTTPPVRITSNNEPVTSNGQQFIPFPSLRPALPDETEARTPRVSLVIEDIDQNLERLIRESVPAGGLTLDLAVIDALDPDTLQFSIEGLEIASADGDGMSITLELTTERLIGNRAPRWSFVPSITPGLFGG
jgi:hypothetical protein